MKLLDKFPLRERLPNGRATTLTFSARLAAQAISTIPAILVFAFSVSTALAQSTTQIPEGWVVLPVAEYVALRHAGSPPEAEPAAPPVAAFPRETARSRRDDA